MALLAVFVGGGIGSVLRYLLSLGMTRWLPSLFPWGTLVVNVLGALLIGLLAGRAVAFENLATRELRLLLAVGFCGGFTTFSTFSMEVVTLLREDAAGLALAYIAASLLLSLAAFWLGSQWWR